MLIYDVPVSSLVQEVEGGYGHHWDTQKLNDLHSRLRNERGRQDQRESECGWFLSANIPQRVLVG